MRICKHFKTREENKEPDEEKKSVQKCERVVISFTSVKEL